MYLIQSLWTARRDMTVIEDTVMDTGVGYRIKTQITQTLFHAELSILWMQDHIHSHTHTHTLHWSPFTSHSSLAPCSCQNCIEKDTGTRSHSYIRRTHLTQRNQMKQTQILTHAQNQLFIQRTPFRQTHTFLSHCLSRTKKTHTATTILTFELFNTDIYTCTPAQTCIESHTKTNLTYMGNIPSQKKSQK